LSILTINRGILGQFSDWRYFLCLLFLSISFSLLLLPKSFFSAYHQTYLTKTTISDSFTVGSSWNLSTRFGTHFQKFSPLTITKTCQAERNSFWIVAFSFPVETQNCLSKTTILNSLTVGFSWNLDMWFEIHFFTFSPLRFAK